MKKLTGWIGLAFLTTLIFSSCVKYQVEQQCCEGNWHITTQNFQRPSLFKIHVPQVFTPNGDGVNEQFYPIGVGWDLEKLVIKKGIKTVYESTNRLDAFWDGGDEKDGRYKYIMTFKAINGDIFEADGHVCVMRFGSAGAKYYDAERTKICDCTTLDMLDTLQGPIHVSQECPSNDTI